MSGHVRPRLRRFSRSRPSAPRTRHPVNQTEAPPDTIFYATAEGSVPAADFLDGAPPKVRGTILAVLDAVAAAPPPAFSGGSKWEAMHGEMGGYYEIRVTGPGREQFRLFCLLENAEERTLTARGYVGPLSLLSPGCARRPGPSSATATMAGGFHSRWGVGAERPAPRSGACSPNQGRRRWPRRQGCHSHRNLSGDIRYLPDNGFSDGRACLRRRLGLRARGRVCRGGGGRRSVGRRPRSSRRRGSRRGRRGRPWPFRVR